MKTYKITLKKSAQSEKDLMYINLCRQIMYHVDENVVPAELIVENSEDLKKYIDPQNLAYRMGMLKFNKDISPQAVSFEFSNSTSENKEIYGRDIKFSYLDATNQNKIELITKGTMMLVLPPNASVKGIIKFTKGRGINNGRFLTYAGFGYDLDEHTCAIFVDSLFDVAQQFKKVQSEVENLINQNEA